MYCFTIGHKEESIFRTKSVCINPTNGSNDLKKYILMIQIQVFAFFNSAVLSTRLNQFSFSKWNQNELLYSKSDRIERCFVIILKIILVYINLNQFLTVIIIFLSEHIYLCMNFFTCIYFYFINNQNVYLTPVSWYKKNNRFLLNI